MATTRTKHQNASTQRTRAYVDVANFLLERLRSQNHAPGTRLPAERQLAEELGVSRPTIREALAALELMGVVDTHVGAGTFVRELPGDTEVATSAAAGDASPSEVLQARLLVEPATARLAALNWERQTLAAIARPLRNLERAADARSSEHPTRDDRQFHAAIARATGWTLHATLIAAITKQKSRPTGRHA